MTKSEFPMHYSSDAKCEESSIARYNQINVSREPVELNKKGWYFAHIAGVNGRFLRTGGAYCKYHNRIVRIPKTTQNYWQLQKHKEW